ncbi:type II secretion system secretin GspD [Sinobacterium caligoides]|uniref:type II secretion system secretin GspD n=1 Tax=Sinobacterium caligoides TaxID=933926 RepID=UPI0013C2E55A|nr:type II secretion system secretin GspD [Sinobacterium caligoides]
MNRFSLRASIGALVIAAAMLQPVVAMAAPAAGEEPATWTLNFNNTDIQELIHFVAEASGKTIIIDPKVSGKVKVISTRPVGAEELYQLFLSVLQVHGYVAVESAGAVRIVPAKSGRSEALPVVTAPGNTRDLVTHVIQLENISAAKLVPVLRPLVAQQSHLAAYAPSNAIIIADTAANIQRIRKIIANIDQAAVDQTDVVQLNYASAEETVRIVEQLEKEGAAKGAAQANRVKLVADTRTNSVLINGDEIQRNRVKALVRHLDRPLQTSGNAQVVNLQYATAADAAEVLGKVMDNMAGMISAKTGGKKGQAAAAASSSTVVADEATNSLIITADASNMATINSLIEKIDIRRTQLLVEAIIVEVRDKDLQELGVDWIAAGDKGFGSSIGGDGTLIGSIAKGLVSDNPQAEVGQALAGSKGGTYGWGNDKFLGILHAVQTDSHYNVLSTPSLLTLNNKEASIEITQEVSIPTGSYSNDDGDNPFTTNERKDVGLVLKLTPHINEDAAVMMDLELQNDSIAEVSVNTNGDPTFLKRHITTSVLADDGGIIVLGGLVQNKVTNSQTKVPLLGDIPLLGALFRSNSDVVEKTNLMIFIRPQIVRKTADINRATQAPYLNIRNMQVKDRDNGQAVPVLPEWQEQMKRLDEIRAAEAAAGALYE